LESGKTKSRFKRPKKPRASSKRDNPVGAEAHPELRVRAHSTFSDYRIVEVRSLAMHAVIALKIMRNPSLLLKTRANLSRWRKNGQKTSSWTSQWEKILDLPVPMIAALISEISERGVRLRQQAPFPGLLTKKERSRIYAAFAVKAPAVKGIRIRVASGRQLLAMKRRSQSRDCALVAAGKVAPEAMMLVRPARLKGAKIEWPQAMLDED
jgi:hypothetical protein